VGNSFPHFGDSVGRRLVGVSYRRRKKKEGEDDE